APPATPFGQEVGILGGSDGLLRIHSTTGGRAGPASYLFHASRLDYDGYREHNDARNVRVNGRLGLARGDDDLRILFTLVDYDARNPGSLSKQLLREDRSQAFARDLSQRTGEEGRQGQLGAVWQRRMDAGELEVAGYWLARSIDNPIPATIIDLERRAGGLRALFRSAPRSAFSLRWAVGAEADAQRDDRRNYGNREGERDALELDQAERVDNLGLFAQLSATPAARLT